MFVTFLGFNGAKVTVYRNILINLFTGIDVLLSMMFGLPYKIMKLIPKK
jgi:hypothetical protein